MTKDKDSKFPSAYATDEAARVRLIEKIWFTTHRPVSLELLVSTTAAISADYESYSHAADAALRLIDTCARLLERSQSHAESEKQRLEIYEALGLEPGDDIPFPVGVKFVTGQTRAERAEEDFISFLRAEARNSYPGHVTEYAAEKLAEFETDGFLIENLQIARQMFEEYREAGLLEKKRRPLKKDLEAKTAALDAGKTDPPASKDRAPAG